MLELANVLSYKYKIFTCFTLASYLQEHPLKKNQATKFPAVLDNFYFVLTYQMSSNVDGCWGPEVSKMVTLKF